MGMGFFFLGFLRKELCHAVKIIQHRHNTF
jgi:hypothetical protein